MRYLHLDMPILKADVQGSVEAILGSLEQLPKDEVQVRVLLSAPGEVTETDVDLAAASGAVIIGFNTSMASGARKADLQCLLVSSRQSCASSDPSSRPNQGS